MLTTRIFSYIAVGLAALVSTTQATPIAGVSLEPRANTTTTNTTDVALAILKEWSANVNATVPHLVALDKAGNDTTPAFDNLYQLYDQVTVDLGSLAADNSTEEAPIHHEIAKTISDTFTTVNTAVNNLNGTRTNVDNAKGLVARERGIKFKLEIIVHVGWSLLRGFYSYVEVKLTVVWKRFVAVAGELANGAAKKALE